MKSEFLMLATAIMLQHVLVITCDQDQTEEDRGPLLSFMSGVTSDPNGVLHDWNSTTSVCNWTGVKCSNNSFTYRGRRRVAELNLSDASLTGTISPSICNLTFLAILDLSKNFFVGRIPAELGDRCSMLRELSLAANQLTGNIPVELGNLNRLIYLSLGSNRLDGGIPARFFCNLSSLQYLDLSDNSFTGVMPITNHCTLKNLRFLLLWSNMFVGSIPASLSNSTKMEWIDFESNYLSGELPAAIIAGMPKLQSLHLSYNNMSSHDDNKDLSPFFLSLGFCRELQEVEVAGNGLGGDLNHLPSKLQYTNIMQLHLEDNLINGQIPMEISKLQNLTYVNLSYNLLNGSIPPEISKLGKLERVYLSNNLLSGSIPSSFGEIAHLGLLDLSRNLLSGSIPEALSNLTQLRNLILHNNYLAGTIPAILGNCNNLDILDLSHNNLTGVIPVEVAGLSSLSLYMNLSSNSLQGSLPLELSKLVMVIALDLSSNNLSGKIPNQIGTSCISLEYLNLSKNSFDGVLPDSVGRLPYLEILDVAENQITGNVPDSLEKSTSLKHLNLSFNKMKGSVPNDVGVFASLSMSSFVGNLGFCGNFSGMKPCSNTDVNRQGRHHLIVILLIIIMVICIPLILRFVLLIVKMRSRFFFNGSSGAGELTRQTEVDHPRITYRQLVLATNGFNESNLIGTGSFGRVYRGVLRDNTRIAVKILDPVITGGEIISRSFKRECDVLKATRHRNVIRIITTCSRPDFIALVLPLMANGSVENHLYNNSGDQRRRTLNLIQIVKIASDVAEGMMYLHHYSPVKVVHCDLKPSNVLLDEYMTAVVSDFGIAKLVIADEGVSDTSNSTTGLLRGSIGYIAPGQINYSQINPK